MEKCCFNCINDNLLGIFIHKNGVFGNCDFCRCEDVKCININHEIFEKIFSFIKEMYIEHPIRRSRQLYYIVQSDWELLEDSRYSEDLFRRLCEINGLDSESYYIVNPDYRSLINIWDDYKDTIKHKHRFINVLPKEIEDLFSTYIKERYKLLHRDNVMYRARLGGKDQFGTLPFNAADMGIPPINKARAGRANPDGISYLYLASSEETAIAEVRPWSGSVVSVATVYLKESQNTINFSVFHNKSILDYLDKKDYEGTINRIQFFNQLGIELSRPVSPLDSYLEYIPTQFLTEFIKYQGFDGMIFDSSLGEGQNVVLFNEGDVDITQTELFRVESISYNFRDLN
ncbi:RES domain-containing protein [Psychrobacillus sp. NPDC093200]|uniref:RES domain-containing protein n=1 Tax=Psychrobacillus sp. NPDC093200 TaxID=3390656 RepID=UPI003CFEBBE7